jgi:hypothetical protein
VSLFGPWYSDGSEDLSAWQTLAVTDVLLALIAAFAVLVLIVTATQGVAALPLILDGLLTIAGLIGMVLVLIRVLALPAAASGRGWALWLGLAGAVGIVVGALLAMRDERLSKPGRPTDATGRPIPPPEPLPTIPAPPANPS